MVEMQNEFLNHLLTNISSNSITSKNNNNNNTSSIHQTDTNLRVSRRGDHPSVQYLPNIDAGNMKNNSNTLDSSISASCSQVNKRIGFVNSCSPDTKDPNENNNNRQKCHSVVEVKVNANGNVDEDNTNNNKECMGCSSTMISETSLLGDIPLVDTETDRFTYTKALNRGSFGEVYLVTDEVTEQQVALKILSLDNNECTIDEIVREYMFCSKLDHPYIISTFEGFRTDKEFFIVQEYCSGGDLFDVITPLHGIGDMRRVRRYFGQLVQAVAYLHSINIAHKDLKPENIMLTENDDVRLIDFGLSRYADDKVDNLVGTLPYMAPEIYRKSNSRDGKAADIWALGVILYTMCVGDLPWDRPSHHDVSFATFKNTGRFNYDYWSKELQDLFRGLFCYIASERIKADDIGLFLGKKWTTDRGWNDSHANSVYGLGSRVFIDNKGSTFGVNGQSILTRDDTLNTILCKPADSWGMDSSHILFADHNNNDSVIEEEDEAAAIALLDSLSSTSTCSSEAQNFIDPLRKVILDHIALDEFAPENALKTSDSDVDTGLYGGVIEYSQIPAVVTADEDVGIVFDSNLYEDASGLGNNDSKWRSPELHENEVDSLSGGMIDGMIEGCGTDVNVGECLIQEQYHTTGTEDRGNDQHHSKTSVAKNNAGLGFSNADDGSKISFKRLVSKNFRAGTATAEKNENGAAENMQHNKLHAPVAVIEANTDGNILRPAHSDDMFNSIGSRWSFYGDPAYMKNSFMDSFISMANSDLSKMNNSNTSSNTNGLACSPDASDNRLNIGGSRCSGVGVGSSRFCGKMGSITRLHSNSSTGSDSGLGPSKTQASTGRDSPDIILTDSAISTKKYIHRPYAGGNSMLRINNLNEDNYEGSGSGIEPVSSSVKSCGGDFSDLDMLAQQKDVKVDDDSSLDTKPAHVSNKMPTRSGINDNALRIAHSHTSCKGMSWGDITDMDEMERMFADSKSDTPFSNTNAAAIKKSIITDDNKNFKNGSSLLKVRSIPNHRSSNHLTSAMSWGDVESDEGLAATMGQNLNLHFKSTKWRTRETFGDSDVLNTSIEEVDDDEEEEAVDIFSFDY